MPCGLVLEGGAMRGVYTAGVLEYFMEAGIEFPYIIGVSAGSCHAANYITKQKKRSYHTSIGLVDHPKYIRYKGLLDGTGLFNMDFIFDEVPNKLVKLDYEAFRCSDQKFIAVTTDCTTGEPVYLDVKSAKENMDINRMIRASSSMPVVAPVVEFEGKRLLDGGLSDSIPIEKSILDGCEFNVVVLTRPPGYRKVASKQERIYKMLLGKGFEGVLESLKTRHIRYNQAVDLANAQEKLGKAIIIQPEKDLKVRRTEKDKKKLEQLYKLGYEDAKRKCAEIQELMKC